MLPRLLRQILLRATAPAAAARRVAPLTRLALAGGLLLATTTTTTTLSIPKLTLLRKSQPVGLCSSTSASASESEDMPGLGEAILSEQKWLAGQELEKCIFAKGEKVAVCLLDRSAAAEDPGLVQEIQGFADKLKSTMAVDTVFVDMSGGPRREQNMQILKKRKLKIKVEDQLKTVNFLLVNSFEDWWFHSEDILRYGYSQLRMIFNYYLGVPQLKATSLLLAEATPNSSHFIIFEPDVSDNAKLKPFRRLHTFDSDSFLRKRFWRISNPEVAAQFGLEEQGAIYMLRPVSKFCPKDVDKTINVEGFLFNKEIIATSHQVKNLETNELYARVATPVFQAPIFIETMRDWQGYMERYARVPLVLAYCDPVDKPEMFNLLLNELRSAREVAPIDLTISPEAHERKEDPDVNLVISAIVPDFFQTAFKEGEPQVLYINPKNMLSLLDKPTMRNGMTAEQLKAKAKDLPAQWEALAKNKELSDKERNAIESELSELQPENHSFFQMHRLTDLKGGIKKFLRNALDGALPQYWASLPLKQIGGVSMSYSNYTSGSDFQKRVLKSRRSWAVLFYSPEYNGSQLKNFDSFAKHLQSSEMGFAHCNLTSTCAWFRVPSRPCVLVFPEGRKDTPLVYDLGYFARDDGEQAQLERFVKFLRTHRVLMNSERGG